MLIEIDENNIEAYFNLSQAYEAEFAPLTGAIPDENGKYPVSTPIDKDHKGFLFYENQIPVGFVVISLTDKAHDMSEFYVLPSHRLKNIGKRMAFYVFEKFKGNWEVKQIQGADYAITFWQKVIGDFIGNNFEEEIYIDKKWGKVNRQSFNTNLR